MRRPTALLAVAALAATLFVPAGAAPRPGLTELVSVGLGGALPDASMRMPKLSADGRYVVFFSDATNLVEGDTNGAEDVFVHDRHTGITELVSVASDGTPGNSRSFDPSITGDGRYVAFWSWSNNLLVGQPTSSTHAFRHDRQTGVTELVSVSATGQHADRPSTMLENAQGISGDGRYVVFMSLASNLVDRPDVVGGVNHAYVKDMATGEVELLSVDQDGKPAPVHSQDATISADGRYVAFWNPAELTSTPTFGRRAIYVRDREEGTTEIVSVNGKGEALNDDVWRPRMSADGRFTAFDSARAWNAAPRGQPGIFPTVYVHDRETGVTERVSVNSAGQQSNQVAYRAGLSADGRYVTFWSYGTNLDGAGGNAEVYVRDRLLGTTELVSLSTGNQAGGGTSQTAAISGDGRVVAFMSRNAALVPGMAHSYDLAYARVRGPDVGVVGPVGVGVADGRVAVSGLARFAGAVLAEGTTAETTPADQATGRLAEAALVYRGEEAEQLLVRLHVEDLPTRVYAANFAVLVDQPGPAGTVFGAALTVDGVDYEVRLSAGAHTWEPEVHVLRCAPVCVPVAQGTGSYGTAGEEVQLAFSLADVGATEGSAVTGVRAFSAAGVARGGPVHDLVAVPLGDTAIPARSVTVGVASVRPDAPPVAFDLPATLSGAGFLAQRGVGGLPAGTYRAHVRVCLGDDCRVTTSRSFDLSDQA